MNIFIPLPGPSLWWFIAGIVIGAAGTFVVGSLWIGWLYLHAFWIADSGGPKR